MSQSPKRDYHVVSVITRTQSAMAVTTVEASSQEEANQLAVRWSTSLPSNHHVISEPSDDWSEPTLHVQLDS